MTEKEWISIMAPLAVAAQKKFGYLASVLIAQACLENGYGMDTDCTVLTEANNVLGMKKELLNSTWESDYWHGAFITKKTPEWDGGIHYIDDDFRQYDSLQDCFFDYCQFMRDARYSKGGTYKYRDVLSMTDPEMLISTVAGRGYCTDPDYPKSVMRIIEKHSLTQYDAKVTVAKTVRSILAGLGKNLVDLVAANRSEVPHHNANSHKYLAVHYLGVDNADNPYLYDHGYGGHFYVPIDGTALSRGSQGDEVKELQEGLILLGYSCGKSGADGDFGKDTEEAVRNFQADRKLTVDGSAGPETLDVFRKLYAVATVQNWLNSLDNAGLAVDGDYGTQTKKAFIALLQKCLVNVYGAKIKIDGDFGPETKAACRAVAKGDKGLLVSILQAGLLLHGITYTGIDASFGDATEKAVKEFQKQAGITVDGIAGPETFEKLMNG